MNLVITTPNFKAISIPTHLNVPPSTLEKMAKFICDCVLNNAHHVGVRMSYCYRNQLSNLKASFINAVATLGTQLAIDHSDRNISLELLWCSKWKSLNDSLKNEFKSHNLSDDDVKQGAEFITMNIEKFVYTACEYYFDDNFNLTRHAWLN